MRVWPLIVSAIALLASPLAAQETRTAPEGHTPPPATLDEVDWLIGQWAGTGIGAFGAALGGTPAANGAANGACWVDALAAWGCGGGG